MNNNDKERLISTVLDRQALIDAANELNIHSMTDGRVRYRANQLIQEYTRKGYREIVAPLLTPKAKLNDVFEIMREKMKEQ